MVVYHLHGETSSSTVKFVQMEVIMPDDAFRSEWPFTIPSKNPNWQRESRTSSAWS